MNGRPEPEAVDEGQQRPAAGRRLLAGQEQHGAQRRADARRPAEAEQHAEQRRGGQPDRGHLVDPVVTLHPRDDAEEDQAQHDRQAAEHDRDLPLVGEQPLPHAADQRTEGDEHEREPEHEQERAGEHPAAPRVGEVGAGEPGGVGEVARQQRHHARGEERDQAGHQGDRDREHQRAVEGLVGEPVTEVERSHQQGHFCTSRTSSTSVRWDGTSPRMLAATRPSVSSTSVLGMALGFRVPWKASSERPAGSKREGYGTS